MSAVNWKSVPVYKRSASYARENGEIELFRESNKANSLCRTAVESAIREAFDGFYLGKDCEKPVIEEFGIERVCYVLAITLRVKNSDGRFSVDNRKWAKSYPISEDPEDEQDVLNSSVMAVVESHPAVLEGFVNRVRAIAEIFSSGAKKEHAQDVKEKAGEKVSTDYEKVCEIQKLLWKDDDMMCQETLFALQEKFADYALEVAMREGRCDDLVKTFPWLYKTRLD